MSPFVSPLPPNSHRQYSYQERPTVITPTHVLIARAPRPSADSDIKAIADMFTFGGRGQGPRLGARELGLPGRQTNTINLIEREESI